MKDSRSLPTLIRVDNGPERISRELVEWREKNGGRLPCIQPGKPNQNGYIERLNRIFRHEVLDACLFRSLSEVREIVPQWMLIYNQERPPQLPLFSNSPVTREPYENSALAQRQRPPS